MWFLTGGAWVQYVLAFPVAVRLGLVTLLVEGGRSAWHRWRSTRP